MKDPYVAEVRKYRMQHTKQFGSNLHRICEDLRSFENSLGDRVVTLASRKLQRTNAWSVRGARAGHA
jgi:hypothetical protein